MATLGTRWRLSILLVTVLRGCAAAGPPAPPSPPECYRPCENEKDCSVDIKCIWPLMQDPKNPTTYRLHWEPANSEHDYTTSGTSKDGYIPRQNFSNHDDLRVWVEARNQHGSARSQEVVFNIEDIIKPPAPTEISHYQDPLEIHWSTTCGQLQLSIGLCDVRYRTEGDQVWPEYEHGLHGSYTFMDPDPATVYEVQIRCACDRGLMSNWTEIQRIKSAESAPIGQVDVWTNCGMPPTSYDCFLTWKNLSNSQACGLILGYEVIMSYNNGTAELMNVSTAEPSSQFVYEEMKWRLNSPLEDVSSVSVSAYNALGATVPSHLTMPVTGKEEKDESLDLLMNEENLTVSWDLFSLRFSDNQREYVVQYKQAGCLPGQGFDWIKVNKSQTSGFFKGKFQKYTPYEVSLFTVLHSSEVYQVASGIGYSLEKVPPAVPSFEVLSIGATDATLFWEPVPLAQQTGRILFYQIGADTNRVYNVTASPQQENTVFPLQHLNPGQEYEVWIRAVTAAGLGANATRRFKTKNLEDFAYTPVLLGVVFLIVIILSTVSLLSCQAKSKVCLLVPKCFYEKVPDPRNSHIFRQMMHQINEPCDPICIPINKPDPNPTLISVLEIVEMESQPLDPDGLTGPVMGGGRSQTDCQDDQKEDDVTEQCNRTEHRYGREEYSKMVDSDEEKDDCWSSSCGEQSTTGYEKHFMPSALEILEV